MDDVGKMGMIAVVGIAIMTGVGVFAVQSTESRYQKDAIEHNCAAYDAQTGKWDWKKP